MTIEDVFRIGPEWLFEPGARVMYTGQTNNGVKGTVILSHYPNPREHDSVSVLWDDPSFIGDPEPGLLVRVS